MGSTDSKSRRTSKFNDRFKSYNDFYVVFCPCLIKFFLLIWNQSTVNNRGVSRGRSVAVGISDIGRWHVTCHMSHVNRDTWFFFKQKLPKRARKVTKSVKNVKITNHCWKVQKSVKKAGFHSIGDTIRARRESWCLSYAGFFNLYRSLKSNLCKKNSDFLLSLIFWLPFLKHTKAGWPFFVRSLKLIKLICTYKGLYYFTLPQAPS